MTFEEYQELLARGIIKTGDNGLGFVRKDSFDSHRDNLLTKGEQLREHPEIMDNLIPYLEAVVNRGDLLEVDKRKGERIPQDEKKEAFGKKK